LSHLDLDSVLLDKWLELLDQIAPERGRVRDRRFVDAGPLQPASR
jgi:hypothetical protein